MLFVVFIIIAAIVAVMHEKWPRLRHRVLCRLGIDSQDVQKNEQVTGDIAVLERHYGAKGKHVMAFSLWGNGKVYLEGALANAKEAPAGWKCRFYIPPHFISLNRQLCHQLQLLGSDLFVVCTSDGATPKDASGTLWRFLCATEKPEFAYQRMVCRDVDDPVTDHVRKWLNRWTSEHADKTFTRLESIDTHITMLFKLKAGRWGCIIGSQANGLRDMTNAINSYSKRGEFGFDEVFLNEVVLPHMKEPDNTFVAWLNPVDAYHSRTQH